MLRPVGKILRVAHGVVRTGANTLRRLAEESCSQAQTHWPKYHIPGGGLETLAMLAS